MAAAGGEAAAAEAGELVATVGAAADGVAAFAGGDGPAPADLGERLQCAARAMDLVERRAGELAGAASPEAETLRHTLRAVVQAMRQRQEAHGKLGLHEALARASQAVTAAAERALAQLTGAAWADGSEEGAADDGGGVAQVVQTLVELIGVASAPSLWAVMQNSVWAKLTQLQGAGALSRNARSQELLQGLAAQLMLRLDERRQEIMAAAGGAGTAGIDRQAKVLRFFATKGLSFIAAEPLQFAGSPCERLLHVTADTAAVSWHAADPESQLSLAVEKLYEMLRGFAANLPAGSGGESALEALAARLDQGAGGVAQPLGTVLCLAQLLPAAATCAAARSAGGAAQLVRLARSMVARFSALSGEAGARQRSGAKLDGLFQTICGAVTQWAVTVPLPQQPQLQRWLLETLLADAQPAATGVVLATWSAVLRRATHASVLHAHASSLLQLSAGARRLPPSVTAACGGLLSIATGRLSAAASGGGGDAEACRALLESLGDTARPMHGTAAGLLLPTVLQQSAPEALRCGPTIPRNL